MEYSIFSMFLGWRSRSSLRVEGTPLIITTGEDPITLMLRLMGSAESPARGSFWKRLSVDSDAFTSALPGNMMVRPLASNSMLPSTVTSSRSVVPEVSHTMPRSIVSWAESMIMSVGSKPSFITVSTMLPFSGVDRRNCPPDTDSMAASCRSPAVRVHCAPSTGTVSASATTRPPMVRAGSICTPASRERRSRNRFIICVDGVGGSVWAAVG